MKIVEIDQRCDKFEVKTILGSKSFKVDKYYSDKFTKSTISAKQAFNMNSFEASIPFLNSLKKDVKKNIELK